MSDTPWTPGPWRMRNRDEVEGFDGLSVAVISGTQTDARLVVVAPEMAEALDNIHGILQTNLGDVDPHVRAACDIAWSLLARIRGEE